MFPSILKWKHNLSFSLNSNNVKFLKDNQYRSSFNYHFRASKKKLLIKWTERSITKVEKNWLLTSTNKHQRNQGYKKRPLHKKENYIFCQKNDQKNKIWPKSDAAQKNERKRVLRDSVKMSHMKRTNVRRAKKKKN